MDWPCETRGFRYDERLFDGSKTPRGCRSGYEQHCRGATRERQLKGCSAPPPGEASLVLVLTGELLLEQSCWLLHWRRIRMDTISV